MYVYVLLCILCSGEPVLLGVNDTNVKLGLTGENCKTCSCIYIY